MKTKTTTERRDRCLSAWRLYDMQGEYLIRIAFMTVTYPLDADRDADDPLVKKVRIYWDNKSDPNSLQSVELVPKQAPAPFSAFLKQICNCVAERLGNNRGKMGLSQIDDLKYISTRELTIIRANISIDFPGLQSSEGFPEAKVTELPDGTRVTTIIDGDRSDQIVIPPSATLH